VRFAVVLLVPIRVSGVDRCRYAPDLALPVRVIKYEHLRARHFTPRHLLHVQCIAAHGQLGKFVRKASRGTPASTRAPSSISPEMPEKQSK